METNVVKTGRIYKKTYVDPATGTEDSSIKAKARYRIEQEVLEGEEVYDIFDIIADLAKRLNMVERGMMLLLGDFKEKGALPEGIETAYGSLVDTYLTAVADGSYKARTDLAADNTATFTELLSRDNKVTQILAECGYDELAAD